MIEISAEIIAQLQSLVQDTPDQNRYKVGGLLFTLTKKSENVIEVEGKYFLVVPDVPLDD